jgi:two-component system, OmpR family, sensor histidine kinase TctE
MWVMTAVSMLTAAIISGSLLVRSHRESIRMQLQATSASLLSMGISDFSELKDFQNLNLFIEDALLMDKVDKAVRVFDHSGKLIFTTLGSAYDDLPTALPEKITKPLFLHTAGLTRTYESLVIPYEGKGKRQFFLQVAIPLPKYSEVFEHLWWQLLLFLGVLIGISVFLSSFLARRLLQPVVAIAEYLQALDPNQIEAWRPLEVGQPAHFLQAIVDGINLLGMRMKEAILQLSRMSRYVAHELRTPLTILQGEAETVLLNEGAGSLEYRRVLVSSLEEIRRMSEIVQTVLKVGERARSITLFQPRRFDLLPWCHEELPRWEKTLRRPIRFDPDALRAAPVYVDADLLHRLVDNLVRNVREHTAADVECRIALAGDANGVRMIVEDDGPGMPPEVLRSLNIEGSAAEAAGIGLNLCLKIAEICRLRLRFQNAPSRGLRVEIGFPTA